MWDLISSIDWMSAATWSSALGWLVAFISFIVAPVVRLTPSKRDDEILGSVMRFLERFSLFAFKRSLPAPK